jgi:hypothetical protein
VGVATDLALALDRAAFARSAGMEPDGWQEDALKSEHPRQLYNCSRQSGKSTVAGILAVHTALYEPGSLVLLLSPTLRQSQELFKKALAVYRSSDHPVPSASETALALTLSNGSRIASLPGKEVTVRGYSGVGLLVVDEAARVPSDLYLSARPMLAVSGGRLIALSTPFGNRGWFYEAWVGSEDWERFEVPATQVPRISPEFLEEERRALGEWWFEQEYMCRFLDAETQAFRREDVEAAFSEEVEVWGL